MARQSLTVAAAEPRALYVPETTATCFAELAELQAMAARPAE